MWMSDYPDLEVRLLIMALSFRWSQHVRCLEQKSFLPQKQQKQSKQFLTFSDLMLALHATGINLFLLVFFFYLAYAFFYLCFPQATSVIAHRRVIPDLWPRLAQPQRPASNQHTHSLPNSLTHSLTQTWTQMYTDLPLSAHSLTWMYPLKLITWHVAPVQTWF